jgi:hypothetical protein
MFYWSFATFDANGVLQRIRRRIFQRCTPNHILHSPNVRESHLAFQFIRHGLLCRPSYYVIWENFTRGHNLNIWDALQFKRRIRVTNGNRMPQESKRGALLLNRNWNAQNLCNKNQLDALFILSSFRQSTSTCFGHICSPSSGGILYICNWYVLCCLDDCWPAGQQNVI